MQRWSQYLLTLQRMLVDCGVPHTIHLDNAPEFKLDQWTKLMQTYLIKNTYTEAYHLNQNLSERHGGVLKVATSHLLLVTGAPPPWSFGVMPWNILRCFSQLLPIKLNWESPHTLHFGDTPDISVFCFVFWSPVWYYAPSNSFPNSNMLPGQFVRITHNVGDAFCFLIVIHDDDPDKRKIIA